MAGQTRPQQRVRNTTLQLTRAVTVMIAIEQRKRRYLTAEGKGIKGRNKKGIDDDKKSFRFNSVKYLNR